MACGKCGNGSRHNTSNSNNSSNGDLRKFAYLTPRQLRYLAEKEGTPTTPPDESEDK